MKKIIALSLLALATSAFAQGTGFYVGGSVGQSNTKFKNEDFSLANDEDLSPLSPFVSESKDRHNTAWKLFAGYNINQYVGVEAGYADFGTAKYNYTGVNGLDGSGERKAEQSSWFAAAKGTLPINEQFNVFGKLGVARNRVKASYAFDIGAPFNISDSGSSSKTSLLYGVGAQYNFSEQVGIRVEYENFGKFGNEADTGRTKVDMWSAGVTFNF